MIVIFEEFIKDRKKLGMLIAGVIILIILGVKYFSGGSNDLNKYNNPNEMFVEENNLEINNDNFKEENLDEEKNITVEIKGEVKKPDVYIIKEKAIIKDLIEMAGGTTENADLSDINRAKQLQDHELIYIRNKNDKSEVAKVWKSDFQEEVININTADKEQLKTLKGIGDAKAENIIEYREKNGGFKSIDDIMNVTGIGETIFENIKDKIAT